MTELCLLPDKCGGFEAETRKKPVSPELQSLVDGPMDEPMEPDGGWVQRKRSEDVRNIPSEAPLSVLKQGDFINTVYAVRNYSFRILICCAGF